MYRAVVAAALLLLAGCSGGLGGGTSATTVTPADVPGDRADDLAPGLGPDGVISGRALEAAHESFLDGQSVAIDRVTTVRHADGTTERTTFTVTFGANRSHYNATLVIDRHGREDFRRAFYGVGDDRFVRTDIANGSYYTLDPGGRVPLWSAYGRPLSRMLGAFRETAVTRIGESPAVYRVEAHGAADPEGIALDFRGRNLRNASLELVVTEQGFIRSYRLAYTEDRGREAVRVVERVVHREVGTATVEPPGWYPEARAETEGAEGNPTPNEP